MRIHEQENNQESRAHLEEKKAHFSNQCLKVLELLRQGKRLTTMNAPSYGILSLPRRILDIKLNGIEVLDRWLKDEDGKRTIKEWFLNPKTDSEAKSLEKWFNNYLAEEPTPIAVQSKMF